MEFLKPGTLFRFNTTAIPSTVGSGVGSSTGSMLSTSLLLGAEATQFNLGTFLNPSAGIMTFGWLVPLNSPLYGGQPIPEGLLFRGATDTKTGVCVFTTPATRGAKKLKTQVVIAANVARLMMQAYDMGYVDGYAVGSSRGNKSQRNSKRCEGIYRSARRFDTLLKQALLSQDPSFPREKSITGVTRKGRRRKGPG